jgi:hypothetical protein
MRHLLDKSLAGMFRNRAAEAEAMSIAMYDPDVQRIYLSIVAAYEQLARSVEFLQKMVDDNGLEILRSRERIK